MSGNTIRLHRVLRAKPEKVYRAFIEADALARWLPPDGYTCTVHQAGCTGRRHVQDVVPEFQHGQRPGFRRDLPRARAGPAHPLYRQVRGCESARRDEYDYHSEGRGLRNRAQRRSGRSARADPPGNTATSAGRTRSSTWPNWSSPRFPIDGRRQRSLTPRRAVGSGQSPGGSGPARLMKRCSHRHELRRRYE